MSAKIELQHRIHVLTRKEELDGVRVAGKVVVVLDILFATTTMVAALAGGAIEVLPVADEAEARAAGARRSQGSYVLSGELYAETLPGFAHPAPMALLAHGVKDKTLIYSTTNGTVAMMLAASAKRVYCGSLLNARAVASHITASHARDTVLVLCSGSGGNFNLEDFYGAGCLVDRLAGELGERFAGKAGGGEARWDENREAAHAISSAGSSLRASSSSITGMPSFTG